MTNREEAILGLKELRDWEGLPYCIEEPIQREGVVVITQEVIDMAIKALEQQPSEDCISREQAKKFLYEEIERLHDDGLYDCFSRIIDDMYNELPPVTPTNEDIKEAYLKGYDYGVKDWFISKTQPSEDCISREAMLSLQTEYAEKMGATTFWKLRDDIRALPSVYPERPKGKWNFIGDQMFECSSCKRAYTQNQFEELRIYTTDDLLPKFCPNCGSYNGGNDNGDE